MASAWLAFKERLKIPAVAAPMSASDIVGRFVQEYEAALARQARQ